jgi:beta-glucosidase
MQTLAHSGCDQNDGKTYNDSLMEALDGNMLTEHDIDVALTRVLMQRFKVGAFDPPAVVGPLRSIPMSVVDSPQHRQSVTQHDLSRPYICHCCV